MSDYATLSVPSLAGSSQSVATSTTSAQSTALRAGDYIVTVTAVTFVLRGSNPTAVANTCPMLAANVPYRLRGIQEGEKLAFINGTGTGTAYLSLDE